MFKKDFKILVVDDDDIARAVVCHVLNGEGYSVVEAKDGIEAIKILGLDDINLVITDLRMPGADGLDVLKYAIGNNPDIAVVILTAYATLDTTLDAIKEGAYDYITKPFKIQEIIFLVERAYKRAILINENKLLKKNLRDINRDIDFSRKAVNGDCPDNIISWLERIERLRSINVITDEEFQILKTRLLLGNGKREDFNN